MCGFVTIQASAALGLKRTKRNFVKVRGVRSGQVRPGQVSMFYMNIHVISMCGLMTRQVSAALGLNTFKVRGVRSGQVRSGQVYFLYEYPFDICAFVRKKNRSGSKA